MIDKNDKNYLRQIIIDHFTQPNNKGFENNAEAIYEVQKSTTCADEITLEVLVKDNVIKLLKFEGSACAVATASCDILIDQLINKTVDEANEILQNYYNLISNTGDINEELLDELVCFNSIYKQANRIACSLLAANGIKQMINK